MRWGMDLRLSFRAGGRSFDDRNNRRSGKLTVNFPLVFRVSITGRFFFFLIWPETQVGRRRRKKSDRCCAR